METIKKLLTRVRHTGVLLLVGFLLIIYAALGIFYLQQGQQQKQLQKEITKLSLILNKPVPSNEELQLAYEAAMSSLLPITDSAAIVTLVNIAKENGIEVDEASGKFKIPSASFSSTSVGKGDYDIISFKNISVQGDYKKVLAFISDLDSGKTLENMVLTRVTLTDIFATATGEEGTRRTEFRSVTEAIRAMMTDNNLTAIPKPISYNGTLATSLMGDDPETEGIIEGFPDITTTVREKGYNGIGSPKGGYVLYDHVRISTTNTTQFQTVSYITLESNQYYTYTTNFTTQYYYTCEADGTVRQFDKADLAEATEFLEMGQTKIETGATLDIDIYIRPIK
ncbi:hypothetical protein ACFLT8_03625 [Chloroflexota bacterium]